MAQTTPHHTPNQGVLGAFVGRKEIRRRTNFFGIF